MRAETFEVFCVAWAETGRRVLGYDAVSICVCVGVCGCVWVSVCVCDD